MQVNACRGGKKTITVRWYLFFGTGVSCLWWLDVCRWMLQNHEEFLQWSDVCKLMFCTFLNLFVDMSFIASKMLHCVKNMCCIHRCLSSFTSVCKLFFLSQWKLQVQNIHFKDIMRLVLYIFKQTQPRRLANISYMFPADCGIILKMHEDVPCSCKHPISNRRFV
jgi:hypothetical protein